MHNITLERQCAYNSGQYFCVDELTDMLHLAHDDRSVPSSSQKRRGHTWKLLQPATGRLCDAPIRGMGYGQPGDRVSAVPRLFLATWTSSSPPAVDWALSCVLLHVDEFRWRRTSCRRGGENILLLEPASLQPILRGGTEQICCHAYATRLTELYNGIWRIKLDNVSITIPVGFLKILPVAGPPGHRGTCSTRAWRKAS